MFQLSAISGNPNRRPLAHGGPPRHPHRQSLSPPPFPCPLFVRWLLLLLFSAASSASALAACTLALQPATPPPTFTISRTVVAVADCGPGTSPGITWGDNGSVNGNSPLTANHIYAPGFYDLQVNGGLGQGGAEELVSFPDLIVPTSTFSGNSTTVTGSFVTVLASDTPVTFRCASVVNSNGQVFDPKALKITCTSTQPTVTLPGTGLTLDGTQLTGRTALRPQLTPQQVPIKITTAGKASTFVTLGLLPIPALLLLGTAATRGRRKLHCLVAICGTLALSVSLASCGGGFKLPTTAQAETPTGNYQVTVVDDPVTPDTNFVQTSLIVPLVVGPTQ